MSEVTKSKVSFWDAHKVQIVGLVAGASSLVMSVSATDYDLNGSIGPILDGVVLLIPSLIALIVGLVPAIIAISVIGLVVGIFDGIIGKFKM